MIEGVDHIGIAVRSIDEGRVVWEALGLVVESIEEVPQEQVRVAMLRCGSTHIELLEPTSPESPIAKFLETRGPGIHHLCLASGDVVGADADLRERGLRLLRDVPTAGAGGTKVQFIHPKSAGGVLLELAEHPRSA